MILNAAIAGKSFGDTLVIGEVALTLEAGERVAVTGPSGAGKTTLLRILGGLDQEFCGSVHRPDRAVMMFQEPALLPWRRVLENVTIPARAAAGPARALLARVGLADLEARFPSQLSLGQRRRLALARTLAARPRLVLMDEPLASLDPETAAELRVLIDETLSAEGCAAVIVTHDMAEAQALAGRVLRLSGRPACLTGVGGASA